ncbi:hypothetical protein ES705_35247 [subsurface metagenome]
MSKLSIFTNDYEWCIAYSLDDVFVAMKESVGATYEEEEREVWYEVSRDGKIKIWMTPDDQIAEPGQEGAEIVEKTCVEWIKLYGRGFLCSTEC